MLSRELLRKDPERIRSMLILRRSTAPLDQWCDVDSRWRSLLIRAEELKARRNTGSKRIGELFREGRKEEAGALREEMSRIGEEIKVLEEECRSMEEELTTLELLFPNLLDPEVPEGADESANVEIRRWGEIPSFDFQPKAHWDLGPELGILDFERAAKISGARFAVLKGAGAALERALISLMLDVHTGRHGYTELMTPYLVNDASLYGTGQLPKFSEDLFHIEGFDLSLIPTAEVPVTNYHRDESLPEEMLPIRYCAFTPCFRAEAGSYGKDVRGLIRQHQFHKIELVQLVRPENGPRQLDELTAHAEEILKILGLPYRVVALCSGDVGFSAAKTYDLEVWLPGQQAFREISSCSLFRDFQARRARLRYKPAGGGKARLLHTINGSGLAVGRTLVAILENYQRSNGSVEIPEILRPYMGGADEIRPPSAG